MKVLKMSNSKLISYITSDFQTKSDMKVGEVEWEKIMNKNFDKFKKAGAVRQTVTQIWNKEGALRLGHLWEYKDEKAFNACQDFTFLPSAGAQRQTLQSFKSKLRRKHSGATSGKFTLSYSGSKRPD